MRHAALLTNLVREHPYITISQKGGGWVRKWEFLFCSVLKIITKGEGRGGQKIQNLDYVIHGWSLTISSLISKSKKVEKSKNTENEK